jgi:hypothetical protein
MTNSGDPIGEHERGASPAGFSRHPLAPSPTQEWKQGAQCGRAATNHVSKGHSSWVPSGRVPSRSAPMMSAKCLREKQEIETLHCRGGEPDFSRSGD